MRTCWIAVVCGLVGACQAGSHEPEISTVGLVGGDGYGGSDEYGGDTYGGDNTGVDAAVPVTCQLTCSYLSVTRTSKRWLWLPFGDNTCGSTAHCEIASPCAVCSQDLADQQCGGWCTPNPPQPPEQAPPPRPAPPPVPADGKCTATCQEGIRIRAGVPAKFYWVSNTNCGDGNYCKVDDSCGVCTSERDGAECGGSCTARAPGDGEDDESGSDGSDAGGDTGSGSAFGSDF